MKEIIEKILNEYIVAKQEPFEKHPIGTFFRKEIPQAIYSTGVVDPKKYQVKGSVGQGNWAEVPWICIFDRNITTTSTKGIYIAYLLARDGNTLYLTLDQGCTNLRKTHSNKEVVQILRQKASDIISKVNARGFRTDEGINLGAVSPDLGYFYQKGTIFYKAYRKGENFSEEEIRDDLARMMQIYADYVESEKKSLMVTGTFDSWEICSFDIAIKQCDKSFFDYNGSGIPKEICWFFKADRLQRGESKTVHLLFEEKMYSGRISKESAGSGRVRIFWDTDLGKQFEAYRRKKIAAKFTKINEDTYGVEFTGSEEKMPISTKEVITHIKTYISATGFSYPDGLVENFFLSLKSKPFVILAGTSGTGKTRLVKLFADAIGAVYQLVPVRPDWSDSSDLFGHVDLNGNFIPGTILKFLKSAQDHPKTPYFLCLDEMNLARVEYYLSDILSVIETRELVNGKIVSAPLITIDQYAKDAEAAHTYGELRFPQNLYLVGTVNMDETTFSFSKKVLDRANTIEFNH
ncbi:MAG TPA: DUF3578 domain-containing protein, partial [Candidatus Eisenbergiella intestinipullorum]|nr:DUF3578 domain-containing protein [Candidatus Eisenbergiella intestinipullorum]